MEWFYPKRRGPDWKQGWAGQTMNSISTPPPSLLTIFGIVILLLWLSQYTGYKAQLRHSAINFQLFIFLLPILLILLLACSSTNWMLYFRHRQPQPDSARPDSGSSPWGFTLESLDIGTHDGVFCNGAIHWYTDFGPSFYFDVDKEQVKEMAMPATPEEWYRRRVLYFRECRGHLYLVEIYNAPSTKFNVWEMEKDYSGWIVKYRIDLDGIVRAFPGMIRSYLDPSALNYYVFQIMYIVKGERDEDEEDDGSYLVLHIPTKIIRYNLKDKSFKKLCDFNPYEQEDASYMIHYGAYEYIQSLACV
ncbi:F-box protein At5g07610 [Jatropha curcas]|uniref:F-box protein At5g07610 n=1 Tax=Jatropha curcas TaxID=180498 RepID=UPI0005FBD8EA|nr:F-box protein At5g07610 [Jatropha curcas]